MQHKPAYGTRFFFATAPFPCPYLPGRMERRLVAELCGRDSISFHDTLSLAGFRRSHRFAYIPVCRDCSACATVRIVTPEFVANRTQRRIWKRNSDLTATEMAPCATEEQFALFQKYQDRRHSGGEMARMDEFDYQALVEDTPVDTMVVEFRDETYALVAACIVDRLADGFSAVYSFFDMSEPRRSLGTYMILWLVERSRILELPNVYLGFWISESPKMAYKVHFSPIEACTPEGWRRLNPDDREVMRYFRSEP